MVTSYDEKGKIFTQVVSKHPVRVTMQTISGIIEGCVHVRPDWRVKDELNGQERFLAVTGAVIFGPQKEELYKTEFLVVNTDHIIWIIPEE